jgi:hypothetical protein
VSARGVCRSLSRQHHRDDLLALCDQLFANYYGGYSLGKRSYRWKIAGTGLHGLGHRTPGETLGDWNAQVALVVMRTLTGGNGHPNIQAPAPIPRSTSPEKTYLTFPLPEYVFDPDLAWMGSFGLRASLSHVFASPTTTKVAYFAPVPLFFSSSSDASSKSLKMPQRAE